MDRLDALLAGTKVDTTIKAPKTSDQKIVPSSSRKDGGSDPKADAGTQPQKSKGNDSGKGPKSNSEKEPKSKEQEKSGSKAQKRGCDVAKNVDGEGRNPKESKLQKMLEKNNQEKVLEITLADFEVLAKVAKFGASAFQKMKSIVEENSSDKLRGKLTETQAYNHSIEAQLIRTSRDLKIYRSYWFLELSEENRLLKEKSAEMADLKKRLSAANEKVKEQNKKLKNLASVEADLKLAKEDLERVRKESEEYEVRRSAQIEKLEKENEGLKDEAVFVTPLTPK